MRSSSIERYTDQQKQGIRKLKRKLDKQDKLICEKDKVVYDLGSTHKVCRVILEARLLFPVLPNIQLDPIKYDDF